MPKIIRALLLAKFMIQAGDALPEFELPDSEGNLVRSSDLAGKKCVIYFYPRDFTPGCTREADEFTKMHQSFEDADIRVLGVSPDDTKSHEKFCAKMSIPYTLLSDSDKKMSEAFGVWSLKKFMGREYMGVNRTTFLVNADQKIFKVFTRVRPKGHAQQVLKSFTK